MLFKTLKCKIGLYCNAASDEQRFLEASMAYVAGKPILSDEEFDKLRIRLKVGAPFFLLACVSMQIIRVMVFSNMWPYSS